MINGITWEEETQTRLRQARKEQKDAEDMSKQLLSQANEWKEYADALEKVLEIDRKSRGIKVNGQHILDPEQLRVQSVRNSLIDIAIANNGRLIVVEAIPILINAGVFNDREHASNSIYSNLNHYKKQFKRERRGVYKYVGIQESSHALRLALLPSKEGQKH